MYKQKYKNLDGLKTVLNDNLNEEHTIEMNINKSTQLQYVHLMDVKRHDEEESIDTHPEKIKIKKSKLFQQSRQLSFQRWAT